jgi:hypothetical protein
MPVKGNSPSSYEVEATLAPRISGHGALSGNMPSGNNQILFMRFLRNMQIMNRATDKKFCAAFSPMLIANKLYYYINYYTVSDPYIMC